MVSGRATTAPRSGAWVYRWGILVFSALWLALLSGCASGPAYVAPGESVQAGQVRVIGRLLAVHDGKAVKWGLFNPAVIVIAPANAREGVINELHRDDGTFFWSLAPGKYTVVGVTFRQPNGMSAQPSLTLPIAAHFTVPQDAKSVYIGTLRLAQSGRGPFARRIEDDHTQALKVYREKFPDAVAPETALMELRTPLGNYKYVQHICASAWGLTCTGTYHGITPQSPPVEAEGFPAVDSLQPTFKWQPSSRAGVSYDLVVYQAVAYHPGGITTRYLPGSVVDYRQGLTRPEYRPDTPLQPDTKYFWTIRLRRGDTVSNWTSMSFFKFMVFAAKSGTTSWFGFSTPPLPTTK